MGGLAFANAGPNGSALNVPRMSPEVHKSFCLQIQPKLQSIFKNVATAREAPGKQNHGDIDFLVAGALHSWTAQYVKDVIGATYIFENGPTLSFAMPYPEAPGQSVSPEEVQLPEDIQVSEYAHSTEGTHSSEDSHSSEATQLTENFEPSRPYVQVDIALCPDNAELFRWTQFVKSDGDLFQIVGIFHRSLGITCSEKGLHIRVEQIEPYDRKKSLLFLTRDPDSTLAFYGFDANKYWAGFQDEKELFEWVSKGRFFNREVFDKREEKSDDRKRQKKRHMYNRFVLDFMSAHPEAGTQNQVWTREQVLEEALNMFGKRSEYEAMMEEHEIHEKNLAIWQRIKETLTPLMGKSSLSTTLTGLRRWVVFEDGQPVITVLPMLTDGPVWGKEVTNEDEILAWVSKNWGEVRFLEKQRAAAAKEAAKNNKTATTPPPE